MAFSPYGDSSPYTPLKAGSITSASRPLKKTKYLGGFSEMSFFKAKSIPYFLAVPSKSLILSRSSDFHYSESASIRQIRGRWNDEWCSISPLCVFGFILD